MAFQRLRKLQQVLLMLSNLLQKHIVEEGLLQKGGITTTWAQDPMDLAPAAVWAFGLRPPGPQLPPPVLWIVIVIEIEVVGLHLLRVAAEKAEEKPGVAEA